MIDQLGVSLEILMLFDHNWKKGQH